MPGWIRAALLLFAIGLFAVQARADDVSADQARAARALVQAQLDAFKADDAERAYSYAAPSIRAQFGDAAHFMAMVRGAYPAVYRPANIEFLPAQRAGDDLMQQVRLTDADGGYWLAIYRLERQPDKTWRIASCQLAELEGRAV
jgi:hypothetical protein